jgi:integrase
MADASVSPLTLTAEHHPRPFDRDLPHSLLLRITAHRPLRLVRIEAVRRRLRSWDFDPRDYADPRDREDFDIYDERWLDDPRDLDDRERDFDREGDLRGVLTAMLETCCRPGEILSLQWRDVDLDTRELTIRAEKAKTRRARRLPISSRRMAVLEMGRVDPAGQPFPPAAYVFGDTLGRRITSIRKEWENAREAAGLNGFQLRDLRHEAASRFEEAGVLTTDVSKFLGHRNLSTTTRYLNTTSRRLRLALLRVEQARAESEHLANSCKETADTSSHADDAEAPSTPSKSLVS